MDPGVLHSIALIVHASVLVLVEINFENVKVFNVFVLSLHDNCGGQTALYRMSDYLQVATYVRPQWNRAR